MGVRLTEEKIKMINKWVGVITAELDLSNDGCKLDEELVGDDEMEELTEKWSTKLTSLKLCTYEKM